MSHLYLYVSGISVFVSIIVAAVGVGIDGKKVEEASNEAPPQTTRITLLFLASITVFGFAGEYLGTVKTSSDNLAILFEAIGIASLVSLPYALGRMIGMPRKQVLVAEN